MKKNYTLLIAFFLINLLTAQTSLTFTADNAIDNGNTITETITDGGITYVLTASASIDAKLDDLGGGDNIFFAILDTQLRPWVISLTADGTPISFNLTEIDYDTLGAGSITITNQDDESILPSTTYPISTGIITPTNTANATDITSFNIIPGASDTLNDFGFHNIDITIPVDCTEPDAPTIMASTICEGETATLNITGNLNDATQWTVYTDSCGATELTTTTTDSFNVTPTVTTIYFVRGEGGCATASSCTSVTVTVTPSDDSSFSYGATAYNTNDANPTPTTSLSGGVFSSTAGLSIDASNGEIDLSNSAVGTYTITYMTAGTCPSSSTINLSVISSEYIWTGAFNSTWNISLNWNPTSIPPDNADLTIPNGIVNYPTASTAVAFNSLTIESGASFIAQSTATGTVTYTRNLSTTDWHLIASPVKDESMDNLIANHTFANGTTGGNIGLASYNNSDTSGDPGAPWNYANIASSDTLFPLMGYSVKLDVPGDLSFTGTINTDATALYLISNGARTSFNLLGNPYTSYLDLANFLNFNTSEFDDVAEGIWIWNGTDYITYNAASNFKIAPTQGFFVKAANPLDTQIVQIFSSDQSHESTDTFQKQEPNPSFDLFIDNNSSKKSTKVYYIAGKTTGLDKGYDTEMFGDTSYDLAVYTELVADNMGDHLAIQTIPATYDAVIPVGIIAKAGEEITFSIESLNLPEGTDVFLEDKTNNEFVNLSKTTYKTTLTEDINTTGRFYIHTSAKSLNTLDIVENNNNISIYKSSEQTITVTGLNGVGKINIYSLLGKEVLNTPLSSNGSSIVNLPSLSAGVYMVKLTSDGISKSTKITLN